MLIFIENQLGFLHDGFLHYICLFAESHGTINLSLPFVRHTLLHVNISPLHILFAYHHLFYVNDCSIHDLAL